MKKRRVMKAFFATLIAVALIFAAAACGSGEPDSIIIGIIMPLTGPSALEGEVTTNAIQMYVEDINEAGGILGKQIDLRLYDNRGDAMETTNAARRAIQNDNAIAIIGADSSTTSVALAEVCTELKTPQVVHIATNYLVTQEEGGSARPYTFRACLSDPQLAEILGKYAFEEMGYRRGAVIFNVGNDFSVGIQQEFSDSFEASGGVITIREAFNDGDVDFRALLSKIQEFEDYDFIFLSTAAYRETALISNQARALGIAEPFVGTEAMMAEDIFNIAGDAIEGSIFMSGVDVTTPEVAVFRDKFIDRWGYDPTLNTAADGPLAHDALRVLLAGIEKAGSTDSDEISEALRNLRNVQGITTNISMIPETHNPIREAPVYKIINSEYVVVEVFSLD